MLAAAILFSSTLLGYLGSGPMWKPLIAGSSQTFCADYWWSTLLYIQNYYNPDKICIIQSWYLAVDMQLFVAAPLLCYMLYRFKERFVPVLILLIGFCIGWTIGMFTYYDIVVDWMNME